MPESIFPLLVFHFGMTGASILIGHECIKYYINNKRRNKLIESK